MHDILTVAGRYAAGGDERGDPAALGDDAFDRNADRGVLVKRWKAATGRAALADSGCFAASSLHTGPRQEVSVEKPSTPSRPLRPHANVRAG
ncbi:hypothetical protein ACMHYB_04815 [Sorangium sp. So ce1128]